MPEPTATGTRVFEYLRAKGISNRWLARELGKSDSYITGVKMGRLRINRAFIDGCVRALGVPESFLFFALGEHERSDAEPMSSADAIDLTGDEPDGEGDEAA